MGDPRRGMLGAMKRAGPFRPTSLAEARRWLFNFAAAVSLLLSLSTLCSWFLSYGHLPRKWELLRYHAADGSDWLWFSQSYGQIGVEGFDFNAQPLSGPDWQDTRALSTWRQQFPAE